MKSNRRHLYILASTLAAAGFGLFAYKALIIGFPLLPQSQSTIWNIEAHVAFRAGSDPVKISLFLPKNTSRFELINENFVSRGYGINIVRENGNRKAQWSIRKATANQSLYYTASVRKLERRLVRPPGARGPVIIPPDFQEPLKGAADALLLDVRNKSADTETFVLEMIKRVGADSPGETVRLLLGRESGPKKRIELAAQLLNSAGIAARSVHGVSIAVEQRQATIHHWLEVFINDRWWEVFPDGRSVELPESYFPLWRGLDPMVFGKGASDLNVSVAVAPAHEEALQLVVAGNSLQHPLLKTFSLLDLPLETQAVYRVLLLIPVGAFLLVIFRNVIGVRTFGTFMPVLIALAFRETQLFWGIVLFSMLVLLGLAVRRYLESLKLLVVPRLATVLMVVVLLMMNFSMITHKIDLEQGLSVALFPMVILTMAIERMTIIWEETGPVASIRQAIGTILSASVLYLVMSLAWVEHLFFIFPELILVLLAGTILIGRYSGYRLLELKRFKVMSEQEWSW